MGGKQEVHRFSYALVGTGTEPHCFLPGMGNLVGLCTSYAGVMMSVDFSIPQLLGELHPDILLCDFSGNTIVHMIAAEGNTEVFKVWLNRPHSNVLRKSEWASQYRLCMCMQMI